MLLISSRASLNPSLVCDSLLKGVTLTVLGGSPLRIVSVLSTRHNTVKSLPNQLCSKDKEVFFCANEALSGLIPGLVYSQILAVFYIFFCKGVVVLFSPLY